MAADVVAKAQAVLSEPELLWAMFDVGYIPPNTQPVYGMRATEIPGGRIRPGAVSDYEKGADLS
jgi:hypothetical protein